MISVIATAESSETGGNGEVSTNTQMSGNPSYQELARIAGNRLQKNFLVANDSSSIAGMIFHCIACIR